MHKSYFYGSPDSFIQVVAHKEGCHDTLTRLGFVDSSDKLGAASGRAQNDATKPQKVSNGEMKELIKPSETKDELEALIKDAFDVDLDKRKGLDKLKSEALELVASNES